LVERIYAVALNTYREAIRDKVLYGIAFFACLLIVVSLALGALSFHQEQRVVYQVGMAGISFFAIVIAVFLGVSLLYKEVERRTLYVLLPKPLRRWEFVVGKFLGVCATLAVYVKSRGIFSRLYMAAIWPARHLLLYPALIRKVEEAWCPITPRAPSDQRT
jgi:ABC-type transport system involved in multi-copper enzyme maturation permease subunit